MAQALVECIPNFSEGRRPEVIAAIEAAIRGVSQVHILDQHSDEDHNRTVITFVAPPQAAVEAAYAGIAQAAELIDLGQHRGEHPRIGASDVVPFVPIRGITIEECAELARQLGERVGRNLGIPVYLYEAAASSPDRVNLEDIRRGEYEALKVAIEQDPARQPDFGPAKLGPAGATVIGARAPLIAYNVYLTTDDKSVANQIARAIRHSSGGLRFVKSIGLLVEGRAQVSMNLTDYRRTPIARVTELIRREAARYGVGIHHTELVGLAPQEALIDAAGWYLQLDGLEPDQLLETRLYNSMEDGGDEASLLESLAAGTPTPGGGSAAAHAGAVGAALVAMVARLTIGKKKYAEVEARMRAIAEEADTLRHELSQAVSRDAAAFKAVMMAMKLPKDSDADKAARAQAMEAAIHQAATVPLEVAQGCAQVAELAAEMVETGNANAITDGAAGAEMAAAGLRMAELNVLINAQSAKDSSAVKAWQETLTTQRQRLANAQERVRVGLQERADLIAG
jgi:glutamate formiminotransferase/formiminotetrahydrofolate cyclodeaminase